MSKSMLELISAFKESLSRWDKLTKEERRTELQKAGILDSDGRLHERYRAPKDSS